MGPSKVIITCLNYNILWCR